MASTQSNAVREGGVASVAPSSPAVGGRWIVPATRSAFRHLFPVAVTLAALGFAASRIDFGDISKTAGSLEPGALIAAAASLGVGMLLACFRLQMVARHLGQPVRLSDAVVAATAGQLAGTFFFQIFGQTIARSAILSRSGLSPSATVLMTGYERLIAAVVSMALAWAGLWYLFGTFGFEVYAGGLDLIKIMLGILAVTATGAAFVWGRPLMRWGGTRLSTESLLRLVRVMAISIAIQAATMAAYIAVARGFAPDIPIAKLVAASSIVMLVAAIPISFAGWGLRELSAIYVLGVIHMPSEPALLVAVLIGVLSIAVTAVLALVGAVVRRPARASPRSQARAPSELNPTKFVNWALPLFTASAVFFDIYVPAGRGKLNLDLADALVLFGGGLFVLRMFARLGPRMASRTRGLAPLIGLPSLAIGYALIHGFWVFGWTDWAFVNRGFGWIVLLSYAATGALVAAEGGEKGREICLKAFLAAGLTTTSIDLFLTLLGNFGLHLPPGLVLLRITAFSANPNALAFQLVLVLACILAVIKEERALRLLLTLAFTGLFFTGSRAGAIGCSLILIVALGLRFVRLRDVLWALGAAAVMTVVVSGEILIWFLELARAIAPLLPDPTFFERLLGLGHVLSGGLTAFLSNVENGSISSNAERWQSITLGWQMFLAHPIFGAGLGAFYASYVQAHGHALVIHSTPLWLMAESGLVGFLAFVVPFVWLFYVEARRPTGAEPSRVVILLLLVAFAAMSNVHELLYQRPIWLLLGLALVAVPLRAEHEARITRRMPVTGDVAERPAASA